MWRSCGTKNLGFSPDSLVEPALKILVRLWVGWLFFLFVEFGRRCNGKLREVLVILICLVKSKKVKRSFLRQLGTTQPDGNRNHQENARSKELAFQVHIFQSPMALVRGAKYPCHHSQSSGLWTLQQRASMIIWPSMAINIAVLGKVWWVQLVFCGPTFRGNRTVALHMEVGGFVWKSRLPVLMVLSWFL